MRRPASWRAGSIADTLLHPLSNLAKNMGTKKITAFLEPGKPLLLKNSLVVKQNLTHTIELVDFSITPGRVEWVLKTGNGQLIEGRLGVEKEIPFFPGSWITLRIPITCHRPKGKNFICPDFIMLVPDTTVLDFRQEY